MAQQTVSYWFQELYNGTNTNVGISSGNILPAHRPDARTKIPAAERPFVLEMAEIKIRAERKAGEMLREQGFGKHGGDRKSSFIMKLDGFGITNTQSHRWQMEATVSEERQSIRHTVPDGWLDCWTQEDIAEILGVPQQTISDVINTEKAQMHDFCKEFTPES